MVWLAGTQPYCPNLDLELNDIFNFWISGNLSKSNLNIWKSRDGFLRTNKCFLSGIVPNSPSPKFGQIVQIFTEVGIQELKVSFGLKILYTKYIQPKQQCKVQIIGISEEIDSF